MKTQEFVHYFIDDLNKTWFFSLYFFIILVRYSKKGRLLLLV